MTLNEYQGAALESAIYPKAVVHTVSQIESTEYNLASIEGINPYPFFKLAGETGEVLEKLGKAIRDGIKPGTNLTAELAKELGDILWYIAACSKEIGYNLNDIGQLNIEKLSSRKARGVLSGSGDNR